MAERNQKVEQYQKNAQLAQLLTQGLGAAGYETDRLTTGAEARAALTTTRYAALVLNLGLPDEDSLSVLRELRQRKDPLPDAADCRTV